MGTVSKKSKPKAKGKPKPTPVKTSSAPDTRTIPDSMGGVKTAPPLTKTENHVDTGNHTCAARRRSLKSASKGKKKEYGAEQ